MLEIIKKIIIVRKSGLNQGWMDTIYDRKRRKSMCRTRIIYDTINTGDNFNQRDKKSVKRDQNKLIKKIL